MVEFGRYEDVVNGTSKSVGMEDQWAGGVQRSQGRVGVTHWSEQSVSQTKKKKYSL